MIWNYPVKLILFHKLPALHCIQMHRVAGIDHGGHGRHLPFIHHRTVERSFKAMFRIMCIPHFREDCNRKIPIGLSMGIFNAFLTVSVQLLSSSRQFDVLHTPFGVLRCADMSLSTAECISWCALYFRFTLPAFLGFGFLFYKDAFSAFPASINMVK